MKNGLVMVILALAWPLYARDVVHLKSGDVFRGQVENLDHRRGSLRFKIVIDGPSGRGESLRRMRLGDVAFIDFAQSEEEASIAAGDAGASLTRLRRLWQAHEANMPVPNSPAGAYGLALAKKLLATREPKHATEASAITETIGRRDWDEDRRQQAELYRLRSKIQSGQASEAREEAAKLWRTAVDPALTVEARLILGHAVFDDLRALIREHPRWMEEEEIRVQRDALFHEALDHFLFGSLFHGSLRSQAAQGLWQCGEVYRHAEMAEKACAAARDLIELYPNSREHSLALSYLQKESRR